MSIEPNLFKINGYLWEIFPTSLIRNGTRVIHINGPLCTFCRAGLLFSDVDWEEVHGECPKCKKQITLKSKAKYLREEALEIYKAKNREGLPVLSLDLPSTNVKSEDDEDSNYWLQAKIGQKDGKKVAVVYFGEKVRGTQLKTDYAQLFIDFDDEQVRFDKGNKNPMKLLSKLEAEFKSSKVTIIKKEDK